MMRNFILGGRLLKPPVPRYPTRPLETDHNQAREGHTSRLKTDQSGASMVTTRARCRTRIPWHCGGDGIAVWPIVEWGTWREEQGIWRLAPVKEYLSTAIFFPVQSAEQKCVFFLPLSVLIAWEKYDDEMCFCSKQKCKSGHEDSLKKNKKTL